ncbi:MAG: HAD family hydrolase [Steroidobacteraceae bacterium]
MPTRAVLFDLGNTLVSYYRADEFPTILRRCLAACVAELKHEAHSARDEELFRRALGLNHESRDHAVRPLVARLATLFPECENDTLTLERLSTAFLRPIFATAILDSEAISVLQTLRDGGIRLAIVSNTPWGSAAAAWRAELERHGLLRAVDATVFCVEAGFRKPHPAPIRRALEALDVNARNALFVGDDPRWDVLGARAVGVRPLLLAPTGAGPIRRCSSRASLERCSERRRCFGLGGGRLARPARGMTAPEGVRPRARPSGNGRFRESPNWRSELRLRLAEAYLKAAGGAERRLR